MTILICDQDHDLPVSDDCAEYLAKSLKPAPQMGLITMLAVAFSVMLAMISLIGVLVMVRWTRVIRSAAYDLPVAQSNLQRAMQELPCTQSV